jgi:hypothetical protein
MNALDFSQAAPVTYFLVLVQNRSKFGQNRFGFGSL